MTRLTKVIKKEILNKILKEKIQPLRNELEKDAKILAQKALENEWV